MKPALTKKEDKFQIMFMTDRKTAEALTLVADHDGTSRNNVVKQAVKMYLSSVLERKTSEVDEYKKMIDQVIETYKND